MDIYNSIDKPSSWLDWFFNKESASKINNSQKAALFKTFNATKREDQIQESLLKYSEIAFIYKQNFGRNKLNIIHHISQIGGNKYQSEKHFGTTQGLDKDLTCIVTKNMPQLL